GGQPLVAGQLLLHEQRLALESRHVFPRVDPGKPHEGALVRAGAPRDPTLPAGHGHRGVQWKRMLRALHVEAAVPPVGPAHAPGAHLCQSSTSTTTRRPSRAEAAFMTVRIAATVRPPRPITLPVSSSATWSSSTSVPSSS